MAAPAIAAPPAPPRDPWLHGAAADLLLGCGGLYFALFAAFWWIGPPVTQRLHLGILPLVILLVGVPHYGATLLRVYERREDRRRYAVFAVWITLAIAAWFVAGVYVLPVGAALVTLYLTWSPWHYSGQNYGIGLLLAGRAGVAVPPLAKRLLWLSFLASWLLVVASIHVETPAASYTPAVASLAEGAYRLVPLGYPSAWLGPILAVLGAVYTGCLAGAFFLLLRRAPARSLVPLACVVALQALWFSIPVAARARSLFSESLPLGTAHQTYMLLWIGLGHALQYLWVTSYYAKSAGADRRLARYWGKSFLAGAAAFGLPVFLFSPDALGRHAFDAGLGFLVAAAVNVHHFLLDGAIWKLRDGRIARVLLRPREGVADPTGAGDAPRWPRRLAWSGVGAAGLAYAAFSAVGTLEFEYGFRRAVDPLDVDRIQLAARRLESVGYGHPALHLLLGTLAERRGDFPTARREAERSVELGPTADAWMLLGRLHHRDARWSEAAAAYAGALALEPERLEALTELALVDLQTGDLARAEDALVRAVALAPAHPVLRDRLAQVQRLRAERAAAAH
jgi:hypothetical protein